MSQKRKITKTVAKREKRRLQRLAEEGRLIDGVEIPRGAVLADKSQQAGVGERRLFYVDKPFDCVDCGNAEVWSAQDQKWYYEVAKGSLYATAIRCSDCRRKRQEQKGRGDPNPIKHVGALMKRIRDELVAPLRRAGFESIGAEQPISSRVKALEFSSPNSILRCLYEPHEARLIAETLAHNGEYRVIADVLMDAPRKTEDVLERIDVFVAAVREFLLFKRDATSESNSPRKMDC